MASSFDGKGYQSVTQPYVLLGLHSLGEADRMIFQELFFRPCVPIRHSNEKLR
jgi:hypothetical protein